MTSLEIEKTYRNSISYSLDKSGTYDTRFRANCIEDGARFECFFYAPSTYTKAQLEEIGQDVSTLWGAECVNVKKSLSELEKFSKECKKFGYTEKDYNKIITLKDGDFNLVGFKGKSKLLLRRHDTTYEYTF